MAMEMMMKFVGQLPNSHHRQLSLLIPFTMQSFQFWEQFHFVIEIIGRFNSYRYMISLRLLELLALAKQAFMSMLTLFESK